MCPAGWDMPIRTDETTKKQPYLSKLQIIGYQF